MALLLTPGLTPTQTAWLHSDLLRLTRLPEPIAVGLYTDTDRIAGRYMLSPHAADHQPATMTIGCLLEQHGGDIQFVAYIAGLAHGVRLGKHFVPRPRPRSKWISDEYKRLSEPSRRDVQRYIRKLLKAQEPPKPAAPPAHVEAAAAREWVRNAGRLARALR